MSPRFRPVGAAPRIIGIVSGGAAPLGAQVARARAAGADIVELDAATIVAAGPAGQAELARAEPGRVGVRVGGASDAVRVARLVAEAGLAPLAHVADPGGTCDPVTLVTLLGPRVRFLILGASGPVAAAARARAATRVPGRAAVCVLADPGATVAADRFGDAAATAVRLLRADQPVGLTVPDGTVADAAGLALVAWVLEEGVPFVRVGADLGAVALAARIVGRLVPPGPARGGEPLTGGGPTVAGARR